MNNEQFQELIGLLEGLGVKPYLYTGYGYNPQSVKNYLDGVRLCLKVLGLNGANYEKIVHSHGWKYEPMGLILEM